MCWSYEFFRSNIERYYYYSSALIRKKFVIFDILRHLMQCVNANNNLEFTNCFAVCQYATHQTTNSSIGYHHLFDFNNEILVTVNAIAE